MDEERAAKLDSLPGWSWEPYEAAWEAKFKELVEYVHEHKKIPPVSHSTLGYWVNNQRIAYQAWKARSNEEAENYRTVTHYMDEKRAAKLEAVPGWKLNIYKMT